MTSRLKSRLYMFNYLKTRYTNLWHYVCELMNENIENIQFMNTSGPLHYLFACCDFIFFEDDIKCIWNERKIFNLNSEQDIKVTLAQNKECISLFDLYKLLNNLTSVKIEEDDSEILKGSELFSTTDYYTTSNILILREKVKSHVNVLNQDNIKDGKLNIMHGYSLIPEYMKHIFVSDVALSSDDNNLACASWWRIYAMFLAGECIRSVAILLHPFLSNPEISCITWDLQNSQLEHILYHLEDAFLKLSKLGVHCQDKLTSNAQIEMITTIATLKDSTIRLGLAVGILYPLNKYKELTQNLLMNKYILTSEVYAICNYLYKNGLFESVSNENIWTKEFLCKTKQHTNSSDHCVFYSALKDDQFGEKYFTDDKCETLETCFKNLVGLTSI